MTTAFSTPETAGVTSMVFPGSTLPRRTMVSVSTRRSTATEMTEGRGGAASAAICCGERTSEDAPRPPTDSSDAPATSPARTRRLRLGAAGGGSIASADRSRRAPSAGGTGPYLPPSTPAAGH
ncbi:hypothetical protein ACQEU3_08585 [Spirillospora sp. CA-253888]